MSYDAIFSIRTIYNGREYRSRFEADTAKWLDSRDQWTWEYEPCSFLLPSGIHYMPDFRAVDQRSQRIWIECRGYTTEKGETQIREFPLVMGPDDIFAVFRPGGIEVYDIAEVYLHDARLRRMWGVVRDALKDEHPLAQTNFMVRYCEPHLRPDER